MSTGTRTNENTSSASGKTPPCHKLRIGALKSAIWKRETEKGPMYTATFSRAYVGSDGHWADSTSFGRDDLLVLAKLADTAHTWICEQQQPDRQRQDPDADVPT